ncbi:MAG TPA: hypothetical protein VN025_16445 [Candidatus Dormibacteraeota bacterium]|jgi:hypothetical protein|nr:hypothetical protein [Candidatus Dormibacteraeota bacterium]
MLEGSREKNEKQDKVIVFAGSRAPMIEQRDLAEERLLSLQASDALRALEEKRRWIRERLREGWPVEEGLRRVELVTTAGGNFTKRSGIKLIVR